jgi:hypothetical protein
VDRPETGAMSRSHVLVEAFHGVGAGQFTELLVHVVCSGARVIPEPYAEYFDLERLLLVNLHAR